MELLILKSGSGYIRVKDGSFQQVCLDKASVFPMDRLSLVKQHEESLKKLGFEKVSIKKLVMIEEDF